MGKIRTVKPELFRHEELFEAEQKYQLPLRLAFIALFTCCDREGRFRWKPKQLKLDILPYDDIDMELVLNALTTEKFIIHYQVNGDAYGCIPSWHKHQLINHRESTSKLPSHPEHSTLTLAETTAPAPNTSTTLTSLVTDASTTREASVINPTYSRHNNAQAHPGGSGSGSGTGTGTGREREHGKGARASKNTGLTASAAQKRSGTDSIELIFNHWKTVMAHPTANLDEERKKIISKAINAGYSTEQLCHAISGCSLTPHNIGMNDRGQRFDGLHIILRSADQIDRFIANYHSPPQQLNAAEKHTLANVQTLQNWVNKKMNIAEENSNEIS